VRPRPGAAQRISAIRAAWALARLDTAPELARLADGRAVLALALDERAARDPIHYVTMIEGGATPRLRGEKAYVPNGLSADWHLVAAREGAGVSLALVAGAQSARTPLRTFNGEEQAHVLRRQRGAAASAPPAREAAALRDLRRGRQPWRWRRWSAACRRFST
jgi:alkylation response protein AidB-like acyl-CoA dehydrogenase